MSIGRVTFPVMSWLCLAAALVGSAAPVTAATSALPPAKPPVHMSGRATIYFLRPSGFLNLGRYVAADVSVDGRKVGALAAGSYFVAIEGAGRHTLGVKGTFLDGGRESEIDFAAGQTYFLEIGSKSTGAPGQDLANMLVSGVRGRELPGRGLMGGLSFYQIDAEHGRAEIATLKKLK